MQSTTQKASKHVRFHRVSAFVLVLVLLLQTLFISASAVAQGIEFNSGSTKNPTLSVDGIGDLTQSELSEKLSVKIIPTDADGFEFVETLFGVEDCEQEGL